GLRSLVATTLALFLVFSFIGNSSSAPQGLFERRNWTPQSMLYLKGARTFQILCSPYKCVYTSISPERRSPNPQLLTLPETAALLLASLQRPQEEENFDQTGILEDY
uniref:Spexin hormone n=1 Tax=Panthera tigris altaica TaxID=74533 RepID=A0A8C9JNC3_PANTA